MFYCQLTGEHSKPGERAVRLVVLQRHVTYGAQKFSHGKRYVVTDPGGEGLQIVKEVLLSESAASPTTGMSQEEIESWWRAQTPLARKRPVKSPYPSLDP